MFIRTTIQLHSNIFFLILPVNAKWYKLTLMIWSLSFLSGFNYSGSILISTELVQKHKRECSQIDMTNLTIVTNNISYKNSNCMLLTSEDYQQLLWTSTSELPGCIITGLLLDWVGRKKTWAITSALASLSLGFMLLGCALSSTAVTILLFLARGSTMAATFCAWVYIPEVYPTQIRGVAFGSAGIFTKIGGMITPFVAQVLFEHSSSIAIVFYVVAGAIATIISMLLPVESMGLDLSTISQKDKTQERAQKNDEGYQSITPLAPQQNK